MARPEYSIATASAILLLTLALTACQGPPAEAPAPAVSADGPRFVGRQSCAECHPGEDRLWQSSHHALAMQEATETTVLGDFDDAEFTHRGVTSTFFRREGGFFVRTDGPDGEMREYEVEYTFGAVPLQQYLIELPGGRLQALTICWDTRPEREGGQRWYHLYPDEEEVDAGDPFHWAGPLHNWNYMCAECHSTNLRKNYDAEQDRYDTTWSEIEVSCEACHGPGSTHVEWARAVAREDTPPAVEHMGLAVRLTDPDRDTWLVNTETGKGIRLAPPVETAEIATCARCHSRRSAFDDDYVFGRPLGDTHRLALLDEGLYHADGQILEEVYVHGSYIQSRMHAAGVTCSDCHDPHSGYLIFAGDRVCDRCHATTMFDTPEHHFHQAGTEGSRCVDCHMPPKNYMVVDPRHDHSLRIPRPDLSLELGTPNACNDCHDDRSFDWAADKVAEWYGPDRRAEPHYGEALQAGRRLQVDGEAALVDLIADLEAPAIARASAVELIPAFLTPGSLGAVEGALSDADPLVRRAAVAALEAVDPATRLRLAAPLLTDPVRTVRMRAARTLADVPSAETTPSQRSRIDAALAEYEEAQRFNADRSEGRLRLGWLELRRGNAAAAEREYRTALEMAPWDPAPYVNLADLYRATNREAEGERVLREGLDRALETAGIHHALGLLLVRERRMDEALVHLEMAAGEGAGSPRYAYVYGVGLNSAGKPAEALAVLKRTHQAFPADRDVLVGLVTISRDSGAMTDAVAYARKLATLVPDDAGVQRLLTELEPGSG